MTVATDTVPDRPIQWGLALRALVGLAKDTSRTDHVFTIISALSGNSFERTYQAFKRTEHGKRLLRERPSLIALLSDRARLRAMPEGSLGRQYLIFMKDGQLTADGLIEAQEARIDPNADLVLDDKRQFVGDRIRDMHDLWHVLTDYGSDDTGEIANLWFSVGQFQNRGMAFIAFFGALDGGIDLRLGWPAYCYRAYKRGRDAARLVSSPIEEMLELPIEEARRRLGIAPSEVVHPEGIRRGYRKQRQMGAVPTLASP
jgi:ubiquinone biosynthesis protein COQ4